MNVIEVAFITCTILLGLRDIFVLLTALAYGLLLHFWLSGRGPFDKFWQPEPMVSSHIHHSEPSDEAAMDLIGDAFSLLYKTMNVVGAHVDPAALQDEKMKMLGADIPPD